MRYLATAGLVLLGTLPVPARAAEVDFSTLAALIRKTQHDTAHPSGTAVAVVRGDKILYQGYFGLADIQARTPVTRDTVFYIASATKPFFALNALIREQAGQLDTRMTLQQMFPSARFVGLDANAVTVRDLLVHTSGVDNQPLVWATAYSGVHDAPSRLALAAASYPHAKAAHGTFAYSNVGYNLLSVWLDQHATQPWQQQLDSTLFRPLGMRHTSAYISEAQAAGWPLAKGYSLASSAPREPLYLAKTDQTLHAAGGVLATAPDLARFLMLELSTRSEKSIPRALIERSQQPQATLESRYLDFPRSGYAWGWYTGDYKGRTLLHHFGAFPGFHAHLSFMPQEGIALVVLNNEDFLAPQLTNLIADHVYGVLLQQPDIATTSAQRFDELSGKIRQLRDSVTAQRAAIQARPWQLSLPRQRYLGTYVNDRLGQMSVEPSGEQGLLLRWGKLAAVASGAEQRDRVRVEFVPNSGAFLEFALKDADVDAIEFEQMTFRKVRRDSP